MSWRKLYFFKFIYLFCWAWGADTTVALDYIKSDPFLFSHIRRCFDDENLTSRCHMLFWNLLPCHPPTMITCQTGFHLKMSRCQAVNCPLDLAFLLLFFFLFLILFNVGFLAACSILYWVKHAVCHRALCSWPEILDATCNRNYSMTMSA